MFFESDKMFKTMFFLKNELPIKVMEKVSKIPGLGSMKKTVEKGRMIVNKAWETGLLFDHFTTNSWTYESLQVDEISRVMRDDEH